MNRDAKLPLLRARRAVIVARLASAGVGTGLGDPMSLPTRMRLERDLARVESELTALDATLDEASVQPPPPLRQSLPYRADTDG